MTETIASQPPAAPNPALAGETLRLKCPRCEGGLNLKRKHLGLSGRCVHCHTALTAVEVDGVVRIVVPEDAATAAPPEVAPPAAPETPASPEETTEPSAEMSPEMSGETSAEPARVDADSEPAPSLDSHAALPAAYEYAHAAPVSGMDDFLSGLSEEPAAPAPTEEKSEPISLFGDSGGFDLSFDREAHTGPIVPAWGARTPIETGSTYAPFGIGTAPAGGGYSASPLQNQSAETSAPFPGTETPAPGFVPAGPTGETGVPVGEGNPSEAPKRDCQERVILDGDGRPMRPMTKEEEESFATNFFKYENARSTPRWVKRLRKAAIRFLVVFCLIGFAVGGVAIFAPKDKVAVWKDKAIKFLEPALTILDYLPEKLRPSWLPQTDNGIDAGVDENGVPRKKMNAFEGLEKLKGDVGNMRGAAEAQLKELENF